MDDQSTSREEAWFENDDDPFFQSVPIPPLEKEINAAMVVYLQEVSEGAVGSGSFDGKEFQRQFQEWLITLPDPVAKETFLGLRKIFSDAAEKCGITEAKDLPAGLQPTLSEISLALAGGIIQAVNARIKKELPLLRAAQRIGFYEEVIEELTLAETYTLDSMPPERAGFLKIARSLRSECNRACQALRRHHRK